MFRPIDYNVLGLEFRPGKPLSTEIMIRRRIVCLYLSGDGPRVISRTVRGTHAGVYIIGHYQTYAYGTYSPFNEGGRGNPSKLSDMMKPSMFGREIRERLLNDGVCDGGKLKALFTVNKGMKNKLRIVSYK